MPRSVRRVLLLIVLVLVGAKAIEAQSANKIYRVGILCPVSCDTSDVRKFREALARLGYKEGVNVAFDYRSADGALKRLPDLAADLVRQPVNVILTTFGSTSCQADECL